MINPQMQMATQSKRRDRIVLIGAALSVCVLGGGAVLAAEIYHVNMAWFFFAWSAIFLIPMLGKEFRGYFKRPAFVLFFVAWMCIHGAVVVGMIAWAQAALWPLILLLEFAAGFLAAHYLFGFPLSKEGS